MEHWIAFKTAVLETVWTHRNVGFLNMLQQNKAPNGTRKTVVILVCWVRGVI